MCKRAILLVLLCFSIGCAGGQKTTHTAGTVMLDLQSTPPVTIGVWDDRQDVVNGERDPAWIGLQRSLYGIPYGVQTSSGHPFARDLTNMLERSLRRSGVDTESLDIAIGSDREDIVDALVASERPRLLLLRIDEWYSDTYHQTTLHYDLALEVLDARGSVVARASQSGEDVLGRKQREGRLSTTEATVDILQSLLTGDRIAEALASSDLVATDDDRSCTVDQILSMRESGLSEDQIRAACGEG